MKKTQIRVSKKNRSMRSINKCSRIDEILMIPIPNISSAVLFGDWVRAQSGSMKMCSPALCDWGL